jgi:hypothetical protein
MAFGGAVPMHHSQLHLRNMSQNIGNSAWPVDAHAMEYMENKPPVFPQSTTRPNPVVDIHDPAHIPGDVRLLEPGPALRDPHHSHTNQAKSEANHEFFDNGLKDRNTKGFKFSLKKEKKWRQ